MTHRDDDGRSNALAGYDALCSMVAALKCDYDRLEELRQKLKDFENEHGYRSTNAELAELERRAGECKDQDEAYERILEDALNVEVRSAWHEVGGDATPSEFAILLTTGGPALRLRGELDEHSEPSRAWLEYQDWGTPWTELVTDADGEAVQQRILLTYAKCFYFGEG